MYLPPLSDVGYVSECVMPMDSSHQLVIGCIQNKLTVTCRTDNMVPVADVEIDADLRERIMKKAMKQQEKKGERYFSTVITETHP